MVSTDKWFLILTWANNEPIPNSRIILYHLVEGHWFVVEIAEGNPTKRILPATVLTPQYAWLISIIQVARSDLAILCLIRRYFYTKFQAGWEINIFAETNGHKTLPILLIRPTSRKHFGRPRKHLPNHLCRIGAIKNICLPIIVLISTCNSTKLPNKWRQCIIKWENCQQYEHFWDCRSSVPYPY